MSVIPFDSVTILPAALIMTTSKYGGYGVFSNKVAIDGAGQKIKVTIERADNNILIGSTISAQDGAFNFSSLAYTKHVITAQDLNGIKLANSTTVNILPVIGV